MKQVIKFRAATLIIMLLAFMSTKIFAEGQSVNVSADSSVWYSSPWAWIAGIIVLVLILAAALNGGRNNAD